MRAHDEPGRAARRLLQRLRPGLALAAAAEPGHLDAQRLQPLDELGEVLLGQDLGRGHQRALPAGVHRHRGRERGHHRLAGAHVALQQAMHRARAGEVGDDLVDHAPLRAGEAEGQHAQQLLVQAAAARHDLGRAQQRAFRARGQLRQLLREQLLELQALRGRVAAGLELVQRHVRRRVMQRLHRHPQGRQPLGNHLRRQHLLQRRPRQAAGDHLAQVGLGQLRRGRVDRRQRRRQRRALHHRLEAGVHHLAPEEAAADLAARAHALARGEGLLVRGIEVEEAQHQLGVRLVDDLGDELAPSALLHARFEHGALDLHLLARVGTGDGRDLRLVLVAQRQVQREVDGAHEAQPLQRLLRGAQFGLLGGAIGGLAGHAGHSRACRVVSRCANRPKRTNPHSDVQADTNLARQLPDNIRCRFRGPFPQLSNMRLIARFVFLMVAVFGVSLAFAWAWDKSDKPQDASVHANTAT